MRSERSCKASSITKSYLQCCSENSIDCFYVSENPNWIYPKGVKLTDRTGCSPGARLARSIADLFHHPTNPWPETDRANRTSTRPARPDRSGQKLVSVLVESGRAHRPGPPGTVHLWIELIMDSSIDIPNWIILPFEGDSCGS